MLRVRAGLRVGADDHQAVGCLGYRDLGPLQQELPIQRPFEPAPRYRSVSGRAGRCRLAGEPGLHDPLTDEDVQARQRL